MRIYVLRVEEVRKVTAEKGVILFKSVAQLKGMPDGTGAKHVIRPDIKGAKVLRGEEVVVPCMPNDNKEDLLQRRAKVQRLRASLRITDSDPRRDFVGWGAEAVHGADRENALPDPVKTILEKAERIEVPSLGPVEKKSKHDRYGRAVLGRATVRDADARSRVIPAVKRGIREYDGTAAGGFRPRHGIRARHERENVLTKETLLTKASPAALFDRILRDAEVRRPVKPEKR
jgi:hypothetical protein